MPPLRRTSYPLAFKRDAVILADSLSEEIVSAQLDIPRRTLRGWIENSNAIFAHRTTLGGQGRNETIPFSADLVTYMKDVLSMMGVIECIRVTQTYVASKPTEDHAFFVLMRLLQCFIKRHGFSCRVPTYTKKPSEELLIERLKFAMRFWPPYELYDPCIINVDETALYFDMPPDARGPKKAALLALDRPKSIRFA